MDQKKTGEFIASCRKEKGFTQSYVAEQLGITDKAVSKWERGKSMPDVSIMLDLCELLNISVNELLTGEHIKQEDYQSNAENNLLTLAKQEELINKKFLFLEKIIGYTNSVSFIILIFVIAFLSDIAENSILRTICIIVAFINLILAVIICLKIEHDAGYYECPNCKYRYVPTMKAVVMAPHMGFSRRLKCPKCGQKGYHKKVLTK